MHAKNAKEDESDREQIDHNEYKGIYFGDPKEEKYTDQQTGAHFEYHDLCNRLQSLQKTVSPRIIHIQRSQSRETKLSNQTSTVKQNAKINNAQQPNFEKLRIVKATVNNNFIRQLKERNIINSENKIYSSLSKFPNDQALSPSKKNILNIKVHTNIEAPTKGINNKNSTLCSDAKKKICRIENDAFNFVSLDLRKNKDVKSILTVKDSKNLKQILTPSKSKGTRNQVIKIVSNLSQKLYGKKISKPLNIIA